MSTHTLLPDPELFQLSHFCADGDQVTAVVTARRSFGICPKCRRETERVHSHYARDLAAQPWNGTPVRVSLYTRRWRCEHTDCPQRIFTERFPEFARPYARRTTAQAAVLDLIAYVLGGEAGARTAVGIGMPVSPDTLLRRLKTRGVFTGPAPRVLGVDDFALRRGHHYGTILVDLERGEPIELLPDRTAESFEAWLKEHPGAEIISRDRSGSYAEGARKGAPEAQQVADRFHLLKNLTEALGETLARERTALGAAAADPAASGPEPPTPVPGEPADRRGEDAVETSPDTSTGPPENREKPPWHRGSTREREQSAASRARSQELYDETKRLQREGLSGVEIARRLGLARATVRKYMEAGEYPERKERSNPPTPLTPYLEYLYRRWQEGCHNAAQLWREVRELGYQGKKVNVWRFTRRWCEEAGRTRCPGEKGPGNPARKSRPTSKSSPRDPSVPASPAPKSVVWWLLCPKRRTKAQEEFTARLLAESPAIRLAHDLTVEFFGLVRKRDPAKLVEWVVKAESSALPDFVSFATGLRKDWEAVQAGVSSEWSNGPVEGQINRLKVIKRQMYGRAKLPLLRARVLPEIVAP